MKQVPAYIEVDSFTQERNEEVVALLDRISKKKEGKRAFQKVHYEFRRRAQSHNPYRIPRRCRAPVLRDMETTPSVLPRRPRRDRRKDPNLGAEYASRAKKSGAWLETHLWHAKRMHMKALWGYKLAVSPTQKSRRKLYRLAHRRSVMYDESYYVCWEIRDGEKFLSTCCDTIPQLERRAQYFDVSILSSGRDKELICPAEVFQQSVNHLFVFFHPKAEPQCNKLFAERDITFTPIPHINRFRLLGPDAWSAFTHVFNSHYTDGPSDDTFWNMTFSFLQARLLHGYCFHLKADIPQVLGPFPPKVQYQKDRVSVYDPVALAQTKLALSHLAPADLFHRGYDHIALPEQELKDMDSLDAASDKYRETQRSTKRKDTRVSATKIRNSMAHSFLAKPTKSSEQKKTVGIVGVFRYLGSLPEVLLLIPSNSGARNIWTLLSRQGCRAIGLDNLRKLYLNEFVPLFPFHWLNTAAGRDFERRQIERREARYRKAPPGKRTPQKGLPPIFPFGGQWDKRFTRWLATQSDWQQLGLAIIAARRLEGATPSSYKDTGILCYVESIRQKVPVDTSLLLLPSLELTTSDDPSEEFSALQKCCDLTIVGSVINGEHNLARGVGTGFGVLDAFHYLKRIRQISSLKPGVLSKKMEQETDKLRRCSTVLFKSTKFDDWLSISLVCRDTTGSFFWVKVTPMSR